MVKPAPLASDALPEFLAMVIFISATSKVVALSVVVVPDTVKLPLTVKSVPTETMPDVVSEANVAALFFATKVVVAQFLSAIARVDPTGPNCSD